MICGILGSSSHLSCVAGSTSTLVEALCPAATAAVTVCVPTVVNLLWKVVPAPVAGFSPPLQFARRAPAPRAVKATAVGWSGQTSCWLAVTLNGGTSTVANGTPVAGSQPEISDESGSPVQDSLTVKTP